jgi:hypothetical protein
MSYNIYMSSITKREQNLLFSSHSFLLYTDYARGWKAEESKLDSHQKQETFLLFKVSGLALQNPTLWEAWPLFSRIKRLDPEGDSSPPPTDDVKNGRALFPLPHTSSGPITVTAPCKARTVFARLNAGIVCSNSTQGMDICVCVYSVFVLSCV